MWGLEELGKVVAETCMMRRPRDHLTLLGERFDRERNMRVLFLKVNKANRRAPLSDIRETFLAQEPEGDGCAVCQTKTSLSCQRCHEVRFCSLPCQKQGWVCHKQTCRPKLKRRHFWAWATSGQCGVVTGVLAYVLHHARDRVLVNGRRIADVVVLNDIHMKCTILESVSIFNRQVPRSYNISLTCQEITHLDRHTALGLRLEPEEEREEQEESKHADTQDTYKDWFILDMTAPQFGFSSLSPLDIPWLFKPEQEFMSYYTTKEAYSVVKMQTFMAALQGRPDDQAKKIQMIGRVIVRKLGEHKHQSKQ